MFSEKRRYYVWAYTTKSGQSARQEVLVYLHTQDISEEEAMVASLIVDGKVYRNLLELPDEAAFDDFYNSEHKPHMVFIVEDEESNRCLRLEPAVKKAAMPTAGFCNKAPMPTIQGQLFPL